MRNRLDAHRIFGAQLYEWQWLQTLYGTHSLLLRTNWSPEAGDLAGGRSEIQLLLKS